MTASLARLVLPSLRWRRGSFAHERPTIDAALAMGVGGFIVFGGTRDAVVELTRAVREQAGRPLLVGADLERGAAQQVEGLTEMPTPAALGALDDLDATHAAAIITAQEARSVGNQLGVRTRVRPRSRAEEPDRGDPLVWRRSSNRGRARRRLGARVPGARRPRLRQALPRARPHHAGLA